MTDFELRAELERLLIEGGAAVAGCADLAPVPAEPREDMPRAVSIGVALRPEIVAGIDAGPTDDYAREYDRVNALLDRLSAAGVALLRQHGHRATAIPATVAALDLKTLATPLPHKTVATLAGIGWIGKSALLVTEAYGSAVRWATILTDAPLPVGEPVTESRCGDCRACVEACPAHALLGRNWRQGLPRQALCDAFACCRTAQGLAEGLSGGRKYTICGICIAACPYTRRYLSAGK